MTSKDKIQLIEIPKWGLSMEEGTVIQWLVAEGDAFAAGDPIAEIESSKIVNELEAPFAGTLRKILVAVDEILPVGAPIAVAADSNVSDAMIAEFLAAAEATVPADLTAMPAAPAPDPPVAEHSPQTASGMPTGLSNEVDDSGVHATLHARRLATELGISLHRVTATGRNQRISKQDVVNAINAAGGSIETASARPVVTPTAEPESSISLGKLDPSLAIDVPMNSMRRAISARMTLSKSSAPHYRVVIDADIDSLLSARAERNAASEGDKVSVTDYLLKATALALVEVPDCNVQFDGKTIRRFTDAHICVAIALDNGLVSPVVTNVNNKTVGEISRDIAALVDKARSGSLSSDELEGGSFTLSNLGAYGIKQFDAIINPPQGAILAVGRAEKRYVERDGNPALATLLTLTLSADHRVIDGAVAAKLLQSLQSILEDPSRMA